MESSDYVAKSASEVIEIVDEENNVLEPKTRAEMRANKLAHRATYAFVRTTGNYFYVQVSYDPPSSSTRQHVFFESTNNYYHWIWETDLLSFVVFLCICVVSAEAKYAEGLLPRFENS